jgi:ankyrin repeat protein
MLRRAPTTTKQTQNMKALRNIHTVCVSSIAFTTLLAASFLPTRAVGQQESQSAPRRQIIEALNKKDAQAVVELAKTHPELYDTKGSDGMTPLHVAAALGQKDTVLVLLAKGADVNAKSNDGETPLHVAAITNNKDVAELLLAKGTGIDAKDAHGVTPLYHAAARGGKDMVELLLTKGANINVKTDDGKTPLSVALATHHDAIAALLRAKGAKE